MKKIALLLSGCGYLDGTEVTECVSTIIKLSELGTKWTPFSISKSYSPTSHFAPEHSPPGPLNCLEESARITRSQMTDLKEIRVKDYDALVIPGGYGVAKNFCSWALDGPSCSVDKNVKSVIEEFHSLSLPIGAWCIAPALVSRVLGQHNIQVTIGNDTETAAGIEKTGAIHVPCSVTDFVTDRENKIISTPAYMLQAQPHEVFQGISSALKELWEMA